jgi:hypothetical protein
VKRGDLHGDERQGVAIGPRERAAAVPGHAVAAGDVHHVYRNAEVLLEERGDLARHAVGAATGRPRADEEDRSLGVPFAAAAADGGDGHRRQQQPAKPNLVISHLRREHRLLRRCIDASDRLAIGPMDHWPMTT